jgi:general secretion pathway protein D
MNDFKPNSSIRRLIKGIAAACGLVVSLLIPPAALTAQAADDLLTINMHDADIGSVIQWVAEQTNKKIVVDPRVRGRVTVLANEPMTADQAYDVFLAMLDVYGFAASENGGILRIFPAVMAKTSPSKLVKDFSNLGNGEYILYVFKANNISVTELAKSLKPLVPATGFLTAHSETNSLLIADESANVKRLVSMVRQIDQAGSIDMEAIKLEHASAKNVAGVVTSLISTEDAKTFSIAADERTNSVLMSGEPTTRKQVRSLVSQLDKPLTASGSTRVVYLNYLDAKEMLPILRGMSESIQKDSKQVKDAGSTINIEASESANALVMTAPPDMLDAMEKVIEQIDIRRAQVLLEAIIVEVNRDFTESLGVEWNTNLSSTDGIESVTNFGLKGVDVSSGEVSFIGSGLSLGFFHNGSLRALLQALASQTDANILSTPSILTLDNHEAEILVGSNVPFISGQSQGTPGSDGDGGFEDPFTTIERQDIGVTLKITPQINEGDSVTLDVLQEIESISESTTVTSDIVTNKRSIKTKVLVADETILVLGGLISDETSELVNKVPILGDLPLVGTFFRSTTETIKKKNLMVFIHPVIVSSDNIAEKVSKKRYNLMKETSEKYRSGKFFNEKIEIQEFEKYTPRKKPQDKE